MIEKTFIIPNKLGLHARASAKLVTLTSRFESKIQIHKEDKKINAKSIMGIMLLAATKGSKIKLVISGKDEKEALEEITSLIKNNFNEK